MSEYLEKFKILHGLPLPGQKITFTTPCKVYWFTNVLDNEKLLEIGKEYTVKRTELNRSSTYVWLEEFWDYSLDEDDPEQKFFRMHSFTWEAPELNPVDLIGFCSYQTRELSRTYNLTIKLNGKIEFEGNRVLVLEADDEEIIVNAYYEK